MKKRAEYLLVVSVAMEWKRMLQNSSAVMGKLHINAEII